MRSSSSGSCLGMMPGSRHAVKTRKAKLSAGSRQLRARVHPICVSALIVCCYQLPPDSYHQTDAWRSDAWWYDAALCSPEHHDHRMDLAGKVRGNEAEKNSRRCQKKSCGTKRSSPIRPSHKISIAKEFLQCALVGWVITMTHAKTTLQTQLTSLPCHCS